MIRIKCCNPNCSAKEGKFEWDEKPFVEEDGGVARSGDKGAVAFFVECPSCGTENKIWLKNVKMQDTLIRG